MHCTMHWGFNGKHNRHGLFFLRHVLLKDYVQVERSEMLK